MTNLVAECTLLCESEMCMEIPVEFLVCYKCDEWHLNCGSHDDGEVVLLGECLCLRSLVKTVLV